MLPISLEDKHFLLQTARASILNHLEETVTGFPPAGNSPVLMEKNGCFVTLHQNGRLRGCIGTIEPTRPLMAGVKANAVLAAFQDPRFSPVTLKEMPGISIEISILTRPISLEFKNADDLISQLKPGVHGVILARGHCRATFLPQVWEQLGRPEDFLAHLCRKAGLENTCWKDPKTAVEVYEVTVFSENDPILRP